MLISGKTTELPTHFSHLTESNTLYCLFLVSDVEAAGYYNYTLEQTLRALVLDSTVYDPVTRPEAVVHVSVSFHLLSIEKLVSVCSKNQQDSSAFIVLGNVTN